MYWCHFFIVHARDNENACASNSFEARVYKFPIFHCQGRSQSISQHYATKKKLSGEQYMFAKTENQ